MVQAEVGRVELDARLREAPPEQSPHVDGDITPGLLAATAIVSALFHRERTGEGQHLDVSMAEALVYTDEWTSTDLAGYDGPRIPDTWNYPIFRVADGTDVAFMGDPTGRLVEIAAAISDDVVEPAKSRRRGVADPRRARRARCPTSPRSKRASTSSASSCPRCAPSSSSPTRRGPRSGACSWRWNRARASPVRRSTPTGPPSGCAARPRGSRHHTRAVLAERCGLSDDELTQLERDGSIHTSGDVDTARPDWR